MQQAWLLQAGRAQSSGWAFLLLKYGVISIKYGVNKEIRKLIKR